MSQNQSYFWQTTRHNVYLKRSAKWHMAMALMVVLTFSTICAAESNPDGDENAIIADIQQNVEQQSIVKLGTESVGLLEKNLELEPEKEKKVKGSFIDAFTASISVILLTELGDKTFFIAAIMAMRHPRLIVFFGAITALALMTVLSCVFGMAANFIPKIYTYYISTALFLIFGLKMLFDGYKMKPTDAQEELEEVQSDLRKREDELMRKLDDAEAKRKNSNSDKEDASEQALIHGRKASLLPKSKSGNSSEMQHRQRKPTNANNNNNNNNTTSNSTSDKQTSCDKTGNDVDYHNTEVLLKDGGRVVEQLKMTTFHNSPTHSGSTASSNQTEQTHCDYPRNNKNPTASVDPDSELDSAEPRAPLAGHESIYSFNEAADSEESALKARLDRDVNTALVHDAESGRRSKVQRRGATYFTMRIFAQAFTMTFLAEWGDRSQLTTIILAASKDVYGVIVGGILGHCICTGLAVIGGRLVASKISVRTVTIVGGIVFIGFAIYAVLMPPDDLVTNN
ncbi:GDT1-like protein 3 isoform X1 [Drosophila hydei]|uniref:GDT1-like protein 3 isoform X1 n=1 Tax=Drosophila hydei TaxID=7224 RepID=A0A6J1M960_DROHY|nr:GDT1-like protein 3 isoform X1 [Drosophila hydei]XP_023175784.1 GDT1-like protein 3 isoform X1 [Drosophila hydei]